MGHHREGGADRDRGRTVDVKAALREQAWTALEQSGASRFPGAEGRIPNFTGAEEAAERLRQLDPWQSARRLKANPDSPQWPVRQRALEDGKTVYMAVPRLAEEPPFLVLDPDELASSPRRASSIKGASRSGRPADVADLESVQLVVIGSVAVASDGARLGKGGGFSDLEFAVGRAAGVIAADAVIITTVHPVQLLESGEVPMAAHDVPVDLIVTPNDVIDCRGGPYRRPSGILWDELSEDKIEAIPLLQRL
ncbi:MAG: 5-formyltetrahydrofolate cyclo-ligase, partial [Actinomycetota bacterium]|nr:5-formyltetrahydrofolate cyclo-ligase [Actinomycetota bacterium]